jgi:hypothetical protein
MSTANHTPVREPELERQGRRMARPGLRLILAAVLIAIPGIVLVALDHGWSIGVGVALLLIASVPAAFGIALLLSSGVARWAARHKLFA